MKKLYEVPNNTWVGIEHLGYATLDGSVLEKLFFHHVDGAYSFCTTVDGEIVHLGASTEVEVLK